MGKHKADTDGATAAWCTRAPVWVQIPDLPLTELCDFALMTQPLCLSSTVSQGSIKGGLTELLRGLNEVAQR